MIGKLRLFSILACLICQANLASLFSQPIEYIDGKVISSTTSEPVPFAAIRLKNNQLGVYANADGDFKLMRNSEFQSDSLIVTCIGFKKSSFAYLDLTDKKVNMIHLTPALYGLGEVNVSASRKKLGSITIIRRAIRNILENYPDKPFTFISYYRDYQKREKNYINLNEAIVQTLDNGFSSESMQNRYRLLDFRKNTDFPRMNISPYYESFGSADQNSPNKIIPQAVLGDQYGNELFILMVHDAIRNFKTRSFSFIETFSKDLILNHNFSEPTPVYNNNLLLYKITFNGKSRITGDSLLVSGTIYVQPNDYSIHKLEYSCYYNIKGRGLKQMFNIDVEYGYDNDVDSLMCLKYISFNNIFKVIDTDDDTYFRLLHSYLDSKSNLNTTVVLNFNNNIDSKTASKRENYEIMAGKKRIKINSIQVTGKNLYLRIKDNELQGIRDTCRVTILNIKDINGNILDKRKSIELYQYRELFVQEYNKSLLFADSCFLQFLPLEQNCISKYIGNYNYWMNTPENIKIDK
ncbi:MAG: carboxypeptidase-like regulatory domain-containing protein [Bacteroidota bacterium]